MLDQIIDDLLFGASVTAPARNNYLETDPDGNVISTCALGAQRLGWFVREYERMPNLNEVYDRLALFGGGVIDNEIALQNKYVRVYQSFIGSDNDEFGRDYVVDRLKAMRNETE